MNKFSLLISVFAFFAFGNNNVIAGNYDFPFSDLQPLFGHTTVSIATDETGATITFAPTGGFWEAQAGWWFADLDPESENPVWEPKDFSGNIALVCEFDGRRVQEGNVILGLVSTDGKLIEEGVPHTEESVTLDLSRFTEEQLSSIARVSFQVTDGPDDTSVLKIKRIYLVSGVAERGDFLLSKLAPLWGHTTVSVDYASGDNFATLTFAPTGAFWEAQAGWNHSANPLDFTGYTGLTCEFEDVEFNSGVIILGAVPVDGTIMETTDFDWLTYKMTLDLTLFEADQLKAVSIVNFQVTDEANETAVLKIKKVYLEGEGNAVKRTAPDAGNGLVDVYTITGIKLYSQVDGNTIIQELPIGIYIVGNKKIQILK